MAKLQFATLENLDLFKDLIDAEHFAQIEAAVSPAIKTVSQSSDKLKIYFYTKEAPVTEAEAAFSITLPAPVDITGKADKVKGAVAGNFAGLDANGNLVDSGKKASDFDKSGAALDVQTELLKLIGTIPVGSDAKTIVEYIQQIVANGAYDDSQIKNLINGLQVAVDKINGTGEGSIIKAVADAKTELKGLVGDLTTLKTSAKANLTAAINELFDKVSATVTNAKVTIDTATTTEGMLKTYTVKQGTATIGVIDVPKDMVVKSGTVVKNPTGQPAGTYIELTLANAASDKIYVNVGTLVDIYTTEASATQVQLAINPSTRVISATIVAGSITATELAANAVTTAKIIDGAVTLAKVDAGIKASLGKADTAVQKVATGTANGTVAVDGKDVAVKGLGTAAYKPDTAFDAAGTAQTKVDTLANGAVKTNTNNISTHNDRLNSLESLVKDGYEGIPESEIRKLFG